MCLQDPNVRQEKLYFFQFPEPFPTFTLPSPPPPLDGDPAAPVTAEAESESSKGKKVVTFAPDVKSSSATPTPGPEAEDAAKSASEKAKKVDGIIGRLEIYQSGTVKMRLENGILLDVSSVSNQPDCCVFWL